ncbi:MAG: histidine--tRNA ligase [Candidatus Nealsonbacteria bacterium CG08_land_8_20_14_0_20_38_20]|uniref:Histidine--tRNA ligase n=1 Tax=Candidatus Nealsonbacteria bacterium CG08_land_8_20_14_0_20_38_20 TaxID=1974705 RepID=A0A2H0YLP0_9BACT|nr:MAG: histidine--tRNA ligase [Candidatus Nealsonbacteria bacterium CG08_land_8_20_14_0_20_38_20]
MKKPKLQSPTGMHDILPEDWKYFQKIYNVCEDLANFYEFAKIETPILEDAELFSRGIGLATDIVEKQMFSFKTRGGDYLALRPEGTAPVVRAYIEHGMQNLSQPVKLWYFGPYFRAEKPQLGRYRQFWQFGFEVLGEAEPVIDVQIVQIFYNILKELKFKNLTIAVNSIGCSQCRPCFRRLLLSYFRPRESSLCSDCRRRLRENPLRILDCKEEKCQTLVSQAPQMLDHLCEECHKHFKDVLEFFEELSLPYSLNPYLVRGLDYYTKTVFEIFPSLANQEPSQGKENNIEELAKVGALVGGGRYDNLVKLLGGKPTPACGASAGIERIALLLKEKGLKIPAAQKPKVFLAQLGDLAKRKTLKLVEEFREIGIPVSESLGRDSLKTQLNRADKIGVKWTLILGQKEALEGTIIIKNMESGAQEIVKLEKVVGEVKKRLKK